MVQNGWHLQLKNYNHHTYRWFTLYNKVDAAEKRYRELSDKIKSAEARMAEISAMKSVSLQQQKPMWTV